MKRTIAAFAAIAAAAAALPADGTTPGRNGRIAFSQARSDGGTAVLTAEPDGSDVREVPLPYRNEDWGRVIWSPDGTKLLLTNVLRPDGSGDVLPFRPATVTQDGSDFTLLDPPGFPFDAYCSAWSPDGTRILCGIGGDAPGIVSIRASDGGDPIRLTSAKDLPGDYSPDGTQIVLVRFRDGAARQGGAWRDDKAALFTVNPDGTGERQLTPYGLVRAHEQAAAAWSPDGSTILSTTPDGRLWTVRPDGTGYAPISLQLGTGDYFAYGAAFSPDGRKITVTVTVGGPSDIYTANPDGSNVRRVTAGREPERFPNWGPARS